MEAPTQRRFIPTCVGQILRGAMADAQAKVHPHVRGADPHVLLVRGLRSAVHPHVRGADPASRVYDLPDLSVHPHVRGADVDRLTSRALHQRFIPTCVGQIPIATHIMQTMNRFIPTCVGQIRAGGQSVDEEAVHPHVRGADVRALSQDIRRARFIPTCVGQMSLMLSPVKAFTGSSPRAWGRSDQRSV